MKSKFIVALVAIVALIGVETNAQQAPKIGWTNVDYILSVLPESKKIENELQIQQQQIQKAMQDKQKEFEDKYKAYEQNATKWSEIIRADKEKELNRLQTDFQDFQRTSQESLQKKQQQLIQPVLIKINTAIEAVGKENSYTYILNMDGGAQTTPIILFAGSDDLNVSNLVLKKLGVDPAEIEKQQKAAAEAAVQQLKPTTTPQQPAANKPATSAPVKKN
ncbi:OmpH family outer membrane protein [Runella aurantiaca]|uniref:OmpH family outer membrane protein n=1 Tax=Runella aurantiaca TaxID=2282308 RepID=A0A369IA26_9BACT|nr:OmpH family outer membrane protein [Runella aurantiaca]RDB05105.1 OmpH family outer membrane protein [Runella aurantiaca]